MDDPDIQAIGLARQLDVRKGQGAYASELAAPCLLELDPIQAGLAGDRESDLVAGLDVVIEVGGGRAAGEQQFRVLGQESIKGPQGEFVQGQGTGGVEREISALPLASIFPAFPHRAVRE